MSSSSSSSSCEYTVDLVIHNGLVGHGGGQAISEADEETKGALTVANLNDTDGDGQTDMQQNDANGVVATAAGRDELDLMKLIVKKPSPDDGGSVTLTVRVDGVPAQFVESHVKLWKHSTKKEPFDMPNGTQTIPTSELDKTLWVEVRIQSSAMRDIEIELDYNGCKDLVKATGVWASMSNFRTSQLIRTLTTNAAAGQNKINVDSTTGLQAGSHVIIFRGSGATREARTIASITGNQITLTANLTNAYNSGDDVREGASRLGTAEK